MKVLNLRCSLDHGFEGWFASEDDFLGQQARGAVECPLCGDKTITRLPSAPRLNLSGAREPPPAVAPPAAAPVAVEAGATIIGQNYVQEAEQAQERVGLRVQWHFIGHLQSNKVRYLADWVTMVQALESVSLARELDARAARAGRTIDALVEVNTTGEASKYGVAPDQVLPFVRSLEEFKGIRIRGLMTIGPFLPDPEGSRPMFRLLRELRETLSRHRQQNLDPVHLSMGMTGDFEVAIEEGATLLRIGTALFGSRPRKS